MTHTPLPRAFFYNKIELEDPGPEHDPVDVRNLYSATYPEITSAAIEGPEVKDGKRAYTFRRAVGTKGGAERPFKTTDFLAGVLVGMFMGAMIAWALALVVRFNG
jgi:PRTRC genetic system protein C